MKLQHNFVDTIPQDLNPGVLYISVHHRTASHMCPCGCQNRVVTPLRPERWHLKYDGETVSLNPSIGNWGLPCKSHYWVTRDAIVWSHLMSKKEIEGIRNDEKRRVTRYYTKKTRKHWWQKFMESQ